jgi:hypothetical protein
VSGRGVSAAGGEILLHRGENRLQIEGPGEMQLPIAQDHTGKELTRPEILNVVWKDGMNFDGQTVRVSGQVSAKSESQHALAETMEVSLTKRVDFSQPRRREPLELRELQLHGKVWLEHRTLVEGRLQSIDHLQVRNLRVDRISGQVLADGPGWFDTVRFERNPEEGLSPVAAGGPPPTAPASGPGREPLVYVRIDFVRGITGNLHQGELQFDEQVRTLYGPVDDWDSKVDADAPQGLGERDILLTCDTLRLVQMGQLPDGRKPVELTAWGNTVVESARFWSRSHRITYVQAKDLLVLEGDGRSDAQLWRQEQVGGPRSRAAARKILYWRSTNQLEIDDARYFDWTRSPGPARR